MVKLLRYYKYKVFNEGDLHKAIAELIERINNNGSFSIDVTFNKEYYESQHIDLDSLKDIRVLGAELKSIGIWIFKNGGSTRLTISIREGRLCVDFFTPTKEEAESYFSLVEEILGLENEESND